MGSESQFADLCPRLLPVGRLQGAGGPLAEQQGSALSQAGATQPSPQAPSQCVLGSQLSLPAHKPVPSAPSEAGDRHPERASSAPLDGGGPKTTAAPTAQAGARSAPRRPKSPSPPAGSGGPSWSPPPRPSHTCAVPMPSQGSPQHFNRQPPSLEAEGFIRRSRCRPHSGTGVSF